jgi:hypothetical protein
LGKISQKLIDMPLADIASGLDVSLDARPIGAGKYWSGGKFPTSHRATLEEILKRWDVLTIGLE